MIYALIVIALIFSFLLSGTTGKIAVIAAVCSGGFALLGLLFHASFFYVLAKIGVGIIIVVGAIGLLKLIFDCFS